MRSTLVVAVAVTSVAEAAYFLIFGVLLFPDSDLLGKLVWTTTCGVAMGAVIAGIVILIAPARKAKAFLVAGSAMTAVGVACALLDSRIDARFSYFGGPDETTFFVFAGVVPALLGGLLFGLLITSDAAAPSGRGLMRAFALSFISCQRARPSRCGCFTRTPLCGCPSHSERTPILDKG